MSGHIDAQLRIPFANPPQVIHAELTGDNACTALGITARGHSPVLGLCRQLIAVGFDHDRPLHAYRNGTLALRVASIGEGAGLEVNGEGDGFRPYRGPDAARPMRLSEQGCARRPDHAANAWVAL